MITNKTKLKKIDIKIQKADNFWKKTKGLINNKGGGIIFRTRFGIHTFLLKSPIDVFVLNKQNKVVKIKRDLKPNRIFFWNPVYQTILEIPSDMIKSNNIELEDELELSS